MLYGKGQNYIDDGDKPPKKEANKKVDAVADIIKNKLVAYIRRTMLKTFIFGSSQQQDECVICLCDFEDGEKVKILGCSKGSAKHFFHEHCLKDWINKSGGVNARCPICRTTIDQDKIEDSVYKITEQ